MFARSIVCHLIPVLFTDFHKVIFEEYQMHMLIDLGFDDVKRVLLNTCFEHLTRANTYMQFRAARSL